MFEPDYNYKSRAYVCEGCNKRFHTTRKQLRQNHHVIIGNMLFRVCGDPDCVERLKRHYSDSEGIVKVRDSVKVRSHV